jgi:hypothetical protein
MSTVKMQNYFSKNKKKYLFVFIYSNNFSLMNRAKAGDFTLTDKGAWVGPAATHKH